jgi:hypothetical protein
MPVEKLSEGTVRMLARAVEIFDDCVANVDRLQTLRGLIETRMMIQGSEVAQLAILDAALAIVADTANDIDGRLAEIRDPGEEQQALEIAWTKIQLTLIRPDVLATRYMNICMLVRKPEEAMAD